MGSDVNSLVKSLKELSQRTMSDKMLTDIVLGGLFSKIKRYAQKSSLF